MSKGIIGILVTLALIRLITTCVSVYIEGREKELEEFTWGEMNTYENYGARTLHVVKDLARSNPSEIPENIFPKDSSGSFRFQDIILYYHYLLENVPELELPPLPLKKSFPEPLAEIGISDFATEEIGNLFDARQWKERRSIGKIKAIIHSIDETKNVIAINVESFEVYNDFPDGLELEIGIYDTLIPIRSFPILPNKEFDYLKIKLTNLITGETETFDCN